MSNESLQLLPEVATRDGFAFLQKYVCQKAKTRESVEEVQFQLHAFGYNLADVVRKKCHVVPRWDPKTGSDKYTIIVSIHELIARADATGQLDGIETESDGGDGKKPTWALCRIFRKDCGRPFMAKVYFSEYFEAKSPIWAGKPNTMLVKVAMAHALRMAFASALMGLYTTDEMPQEPTQEVPSQAETKQKPAKSKEFYSDSAKADADQLKELKALATQKKNLLSDEDKAILRPLFKSCSQDVFHEWVQKLNKIQPTQEAQETEATELPAEEKPGKMSDEITPAQRTAIEAQMNKLSNSARLEWIDSFDKVTTRQEAGKFLVMIGRAVLDQQKKAATPSGDQLEDAFSKQE